MRAEVVVAACLFALLSFLFGAHLTTTLNLGQPATSWEGHQTAAGANSLEIPSTAKQSRYSKEMEFEWINSKLVAPDVNTQCGLPKFPVDCQAWYKVRDIEESVKYMDDNSDEIIPYAQEKLEKRAREAALQCKDVDVEAITEGAVLERGGWCLQQDPNNSNNLISYQDMKLEIPKFHVRPSERIVTVLSDLIASENITSINDFGAGVGQYKMAILANHPNMDYRAFDGAGNIVEYSKGFLKYFDLTYPLGLPKADWVLSLEVGEHVPNKHEGMILWNMHRHNRKGIILSWGILGQGGHSHVNNHANEYVVNVFAELGYTFDKPLSEKFRNKQNNHDWFTRSVMVFRRVNPL